MSEPPIVTDQPVGQRQFEQYEKRIDERFEAVDKRFDQMEKRVDQKFEAVDKRFDQIDRRFDRLERFIFTIMASVVVGIILTLFNTFAK